MAINLSSSHFFFSWPFFLFSSFLTFFRLNKVYIIPTHPQLSLTGFARLWDSITLNMTAPHVSSPGSLIMCIWDLLPHLKRFLYSLLFSVFFHLFLPINSVIFTLSPYPSPSFNLLNTMSNLNCPGFSLGKKNTTFSCDKSSQDLIS